ncbi:TIGR02281 family clan AA aspartic protease [Endothiovibrio diazotrophicus]
MTLLGLLVAGAVVAAPTLRVVGLFKDRAVVMVDGKRRLLKVGERSPEGVVLVSAYSAEAVLEWEGERRVYRLDGRAGGVYREREQPEVRIHARGDHFFDTGRVNGREVRFLVDTGASSVTLNGGEARRLGLDYRRLGERVRVSTASQNTVGYRMKLDTVELGEIRLSNVEAIVLEGGQPDVALLGMSFLGRVEMEHRGALMVLRGR